MKEVKPSCRSCIHYSEFKQLTKDVGYPVRKCAIKGQILIVFNCDKFKEKGDTDYNKKRSEQGI